MSQTLRHSGGRLASPLSAGLLFALVLALAPARVPAQTAPTRAPAQPAAAPDLARAPLEGYPTEIAQSLLRSRLAAEEAAKSTHQPGLFAFVSKNFLWTRGTRLIVAFRGGNFEVWRDISLIAAQWSMEANVSFDFGLDPVAKTARQWAAGDPPGVAQVRIDLEPSDARLRWSAVGREALGSSFPGATMALGGIAATHGFWTTEDRADILHEFGHVLGFLHEQQRPECIAEYRLERGPAGEPTIFEIYENVFRAKRSWIEANVLLANTYIGESSGKPDKGSLFLYPTLDPILPATVNGTKGACYVKKKNLRMSSEDKRRARRDYPFAPADAVGDFALSNVAPLKFLASAGLSAPTALTDKLDELERAGRPVVYVQIAGPQQRPQGEAIRRRLLAAGFIAPGVEDVSRKAQLPKQAEVRYFSAADRQVAEDIGTMIAAELALPGPPPVRFIRKASTKRLPLEIWLAVAVGSAGQAR